MSPDAASMDNAESSITRDILSILEKHLSFFFSPPNQLYIDFMFYGLFFFHNVTWSRTMLDYLKVSVSLDLQGTVETQFYSNFF